MSLNILKYSFVALTAPALVSSFIEYGMNKTDIEIEPPSDSVSIIIPSLNEERFIVQCLRSLRNQSIVNKYPDKFEYILVDSGSTDNTVKLAEPYVDKVFNSPRGKLTSRNIGTDISTGNIIVSVDSDTIYPPAWMNTLLKPFNNQEVVGVVGSTTDSTIPYIPKQVYLLTASFERYITHPTQMVGRNSAYYKHLFYMTGKFNTKINQQNLDEVLKEEEVDFGKRLSEYGTIVFKLNAPCIHLGGEKIACRMNIESKNTCNKYGIGIERFG